MTVCLLAKNLLLSTQLSFGERVVTLFLVITIITFPSTIVSQSKPNSRAVDDTFQTLHVDAYRNKAFDYLSRIEHDDPNSHFLLAFR